MKSPTVPSFVTTNPIPGAPERFIPPLVCSLKQTRHLLGEVAHSTLYRWMDEGILPTIKVGGRRMCRYQDLVSFIESLPSTGSDAA